MNGCKADKLLASDTLNYCKHDVIYFINTFCWTYDPRTPDAKIPFILYDFQETAVFSILHAIEYKKDLLIEKSRDMGISWLVLCVFFHKWLFEPGSDFRLGSRKEEFVDKPRVIDTLFEKVRFLLEHLPRFMHPYGFKWQEHSSYMKLYNPYLRNTIIGESANDDFSSGGRSKAVLLDEFAKWETNTAKAAWTATADTTPCRIPVSTPKGSANKFAQLASGQDEKIAKVTLHWTLHPDKAKGCYYLSGDVKIPIPTAEDAYRIWKSGVRVRSPWYDAEAERRSESDLAQEVDINYLQSGSPFFDIQRLKLQRVWQYMERKGPEDNIPYGYYVTGKLSEHKGKVEFKELRQEALKIYEMPKDTHQYVVGADTSEGLAKGDESFLVVRDKWTRNVVAVAHGLFKPDEFAVMLQKVGKFYGAELAVENNNHGFSVCSDLSVMDCNLYYTTTETTRKAGFTTNARTRPQMLDAMDEDMRKGAMELRDKYLIDECLTFVRNEKRGTPEADGDFKDDGVIACAIAGYVINEKPYIQRENLAAKRKAVYEDRRKVLNGGFTYKKVGV